MKAARLEATSPERPGADPTGWSHSAEARSPEPPVAATSREPAAVPRDCPGRRSRPVPGRPVPARQGTRFRDRWGSAARRGRTTPVESHLPAGRPGRRYPDPSWRPRQVRPEPSSISSVRLTRSSRPARAMVGPIVAARNHRRCATRCGCATRRGPRVLASDTAPPALQTGLRRRGRRSRRALAGRQSASGARYPFRAYSAGEPKIRLIQSSFWVTRT
jgi:hypothetical protein